MEFMRLIKDIRTDRGITQKQFAREIEYSIRTFQDWEQGRACPSARAQNTIKRVLRENYDIYFKDEERK